MPDSTSHKGLSPAMAELSRSFRSSFPYNNVVLLPPRRVATSRVWALPRSLATTGGIIHLFSLPRGTKMFQFPRFASLRKQGCQSFRLAGCPIRISPDQRSFAPTRSLTQLITSFIASMSLGIRHSPFPTFFRYSAVSSSLCAHRLAAERLRVDPADHSYFQLYCLFFLPRNGRTLRRAGRGRFFLKNFCLTLQFCLCQYVKDLLSNAQSIMHNAQYDDVSRYAWRITDSNRRPLACHASALAS